MTTEVNGQLATTHKLAAPPTPRWRRAFVTSSILVAMLISGAGLLPPLLVHTSLRNQVLHSALKTEELTATSEDASGGWLAPLVFRNVRIVDARGRFICTIRELRTSRGLLGFIGGGESIGQVTLIEPRIEIHVSEDGKWPDCRQQPSKTQLSFLVEDGSLLVTVPWRKTAIVDVDDLKVAGRIAPGDDGGRMLIVEPIQIFDHEPLSESHTQQNLALIAPVLSQATQLSGSASVWLDELRVPLDGTQKSRSPVRGRAEFHSLEARLKDEWTRQLAAVSGAMTGTELPDRIEVLKDSKVTFAISEEGITHDGMVFLLPKIAQELRVTSSGIIHLDESLDLRLAVALPKILHADRPMLAILSQLSAEPLQLVVKGTVSRPQLQLPEGLNPHKAFAKGIAPATHQEIAPTVPAAISDILQGVANPDQVEARKDLPGSILNLIRAIDKNAKQNGKQNPKRTKRRRP